MRGRFRLVTAFTWWSCLTAITCAQPDTPLPPPRPLPPETDRAAPTCPGPRSCRNHDLPNPSGDPSSNPLRQEIERLRQERERLRQTRLQPLLQVPPESPGETDWLQRQVQRLLLQFVMEHGEVGHTNNHKLPQERPSSTRTTASGEQSAPSQAGDRVHAPRNPEGKPPATVTPRRTTVADPDMTGSSHAPSAAPSHMPNAPEKPIAPLELGQTLFRAGNYEAALAAFRLVELSGLSREDRLLLQYLQATCLRRMGRNDEAVMLLREIANSRSEAFAVECAQWQLSQIRWQEETHRRLQQIRAAREQQPSRR
ncbi:MAG: tetratricopeptide repeat protein [Gemmatales bacterium]|nr:tetratricopeptide repeat protein [Gemmatales bacterium]MDW7995285.1 tetratricopeptide repeat protein [Gemmatales bacterium]